MAACTVEADHVRLTAKAKRSRLSDGGHPNDCDTVRKRDCRKKTGVSYAQCSTDYVSRSLYASVKRCFPCLSARFLWSASVEEYKGDTYNRS